MNSSNNKDCCIYNNCCPTCIGPTGATGPIGPTGPTGPISSKNSIESMMIAYDKTSLASSKSNINLGKIINSTGSSITFISPYIINISAGTYYILFSAVASNTSSHGDIGASLNVNGVTTNTASIYVSYSVNTLTLVLQHNLTVTENTKIEFINLSTVSNNYHDTNVNIIKLI